MPFKVEIVVLQGSLEGRKLFFAAKQNSIRGAHFHSFKDFKKVKKNEHVFFSAKECIAIDY